ncbi:Orphan sodium- and chloride-dependent neurotransmitter transporter NTT4, partial [Anas platyrhynchos]
EELDAENRPAWNSKLQYILAQIGYSVGLGNVWRFPYLCQKNGGGAYLVPYLVLLIIIGLPLFFLELAVGQRIRRGSIGVWNYICPRLGGIGYASCLVCFFVGLYYNVIIGWSIFYFFKSFQYPLPWSECPIARNGSVAGEDGGDAAGREQFLGRGGCRTLETPDVCIYWRLGTLEAGESPGDMDWMGEGATGSSAVQVPYPHGDVSSGCAHAASLLPQVMYFSSLFPYVVLVCFLVRGLLLRGAVDGIMHMFTPKLDKMLDPQVWREAATQVFFALGLGFGGVIAFSSYNKQDNNCHFDATLVSFINFFTSVLATLVVFAVLGFKANIMNEKCVSVQGTGLAFIAFTEAMTHFPASPFWSVMFFLMLINLGLGSMIGTMSGITTPIIDTFKVRKEVFTVGCCIFAFVIGLIFVQRSGNYFVTMFDDYSATLPLTVVVILENIAVAWIYGTKK